jgi:hypothetical protein
MVHRERRKYLLADFFSRFYLNFIAGLPADDWMSQIESLAYKLPSSTTGINFNI